MDATKPSSLGSFGRIYANLPGGWLTLPEAELLYDVASATDGPILEVGSYLGRSTVLLASLGRVVYSVDSYDGKWKSNKRGISIRDQFLAVTSRYANIHAFQCRIEDWTVRSCGFAYLDGDHSYDGTNAQIATALRCGVSSIAAHDVNDGGGGVHVKQACLDLLGPWDVRLARLAVWKTL